MKSFKTFNESIMEGSALLTKLFLATICYKVHAELTVLMALFYCVHIASKLYYLYVKEKEDEMYLAMVSEAMEKARQEYENQKNETK
jgi:cytochrome b